MRIQGTLTHKPDAGGYWLLDIPEHETARDLIGARVSPMLGAAEILLALGDALKPIVERENLDDVHIDVRRHDGSGVGTLIVKDRMIAPIVAKGGGAGAPT